MITSFIIHYMLEKQTWVYRSDSGHGILNLFAITFIRFGSSLNRQFRDLSLEAPHNLRRSLLVQQCGGFTHRYMGIWAFEHLTLKTVRDWRLLQHE